jgi:hypothetical protein
MIRCILKKEGESDPLSLKLELFEAPSSLAPMEQEKHLAIMNGSGPGSDPQKPLALVIVDVFDKKICAKLGCGERTECASDWILAHFLCEENGRSRLLHELEDVLHARDIRLRNAPWRNNINMGASKQMSDDYRTILTVVRNSPEYKTDAGDSRWLSFERGDVLHTDGIRLDNVGIKTGWLDEGKQMSGDLKILTVVQATLQKKKLLTPIGLATALVMLDVRTN